MAIQVRFIDRIVNIRVDDQHLSRLTESEVDELICQLLMFGGSVLRQKIRKWLDPEDGAIEKIAAVIAPDLPEPPVQ